MSTDAARPVDGSPVADFLTSAASGPTGLVIEGEAGIGKTTLWLSLVEKARERGFLVLSARVGQAESVLAFAALADLLGDLEVDRFARLPDLQRLALDRVLLRASAEGPVTDQRTVAAGFVSLMHNLAIDTPVIVAVDDVQWLDTSSRAAVQFAARRMTGPFGVLLTERCRPGDGTTATWLQLSRPDGLERNYVRPLSLGRLHALISERLGRTFPRPTMLRIAEISGGNPFYALELAYAIGGRTSNADQPLPGTLAELVRMRIGQIDDEARTMLLTAACVADPTVELLAQANDTTAAHVVKRLEDVETAGIVTLEGNRVHFIHPLLANGVYNEASPAVRRAMHRALGAIETQPELKARHLALAAASGDEEILEALDQAADAARARGAPATAAELLDLAMRLGGDTPLRRIRLAENHFRAGDTTQAGVVLDAAQETMPPGIMRALAFILLATVRIYQNGHVEAASLLRTALDDAAGNVPVMVDCLIRLSFTENSIGEFDDALRHVRDAVKLADELGVPAITSQALAWSVQMSFQCGEGVDEAGMNRAMELYDSSFDVPIIVRAPVVRALMLSWTGRLDRAHTELTAARRHCVDRGAESDMMAIAGYLAINHIWRGRLADAEAEINEAVERAEQLGGDDVLIIPLTVRAALAAYTGREREARADAHWVLEAIKNRRSPHMADWPGMTLCFLEVSLSNYDEALKVLDTKFLKSGRLPGTEMMLSWYLPDAVEAMVGVGRTDDAEALTRSLEDNGREHGRTWMLAVGARCRAMLLAAAGDVAAAERKAHQAMAEHERLPMPFERARTQLLLGQLQRRLRQKQAAAAAFTDALDTFETLGTPLWVNRARAELTRTNVGPTDEVGALTPSEQRVAEMAGSGMTTRDIATAMFISPKTVEHNLTRIYRKLGIRSRAELGRRMYEASLDQRSP